MPAIFHNNYEASTPKNNCISKNAICLDWDFHYLRILGPRTHLRTLLPLLYLNPHYLQNTLTKKSIQTCFKTDQQTFLSSVIGWADSLLDYSSPPIHPSQFISGQYSMVYSSPCKFILNYSSPV